MDRFDGGARALERPGGFQIAIGAGGAKNQGGGLHTAISLSIFVA